MLGNCGSAFVEILVGRSMWPAGKDYVTLLPSTMLMLPAESKTAGKKNEEVKMFDQGENALIIHYFIHCNIDFRRFFLWLHSSCTLDTTAPPFRISLLRQGLGKVQIPLNPGADLAWECRGSMCTPPSGV